MSDSKKEPRPQDDESWGAAAPLADGESPNRSSGIIYLHNSGEPLPNADSREAFVRFASEQVLRGFVIQPGDIDRGIIPDSGQMAFAAAYLFMRGVVVRSDEDVDRLAEGSPDAKLELILLQATRELEFNPDRLWTIRKTAQACFAPKALPSAESMGESEILVTTFRRFRRLAAAPAEHRLQIIVRYVYVCRGDAAHIGANLRNEADGIVAMTRRSLESTNEVTFEFISERDLIV